jgi:hypothetical protein
MKWVYGLVIILVCYMVYRYFFASSLLPKKWVEPFNKQQLEDPVFLFDWMIDLLETNASPQLNYNAPYIYAEMDQTKRKQFIEDIKNKGITFQTPIVNVRCSAVLNPTIYNGLTSTGLTTISCNQDHNCICGANVTIVGIPGLEGFYPNGVSLWNNSNEKSQSIDRVDADSSTGKGSAFETLHSFLLIKDSSQLPQIKDGVNKGYISSIPTNAYVKVEYRIDSSMKFNEWWSALVATMNYLYGTTYHAKLKGYTTDVYGTMVSNWISLSSNSTATYIKRMKHTTLTDPTTYVITNGLRSTRYNTIIETLFLLFKRGNINDPYNAVPLFDSFFRPTIDLSYDSVGVPDVYGPTESCHIIPILHYLIPGSVKNIYWGLDGTGTKTKDQLDATSYLNLFNISDKSVVGGTVLVGKLFDWINPYDKESVKKGLLYPNPQTWVLMGSKDIREGRDRKNCYLKYYCGIIKPEYSNGRKLGYIFFEDFSYYSTVANGMANIFSPPPPPSLQHIWSKWFQADFALMSILSSMMHYLVSEQQCDHIIYDNRTNKGGLRSESFASFFGTQRWNWSGYQVRIDSGYSPLLKTTTDQIDQYYEQLWCNMADTFEGCSFKGTKETPKKVIILNNYSASSEGENISTHFFGDRGDHYLGSYTYSRFVGAKSIGCINSGNNQSINTPTLSSRINTNIEFSLETGFPGTAVALYSVPDGPRFRKSWFSDGFWNQMDLLPSATPEDLKGKAGGNSLRNDMSLLYYAFGILPAPQGYFLQHTNYKPPVTNDPTTWKDPWLEQAIREAISQDITLPSIDHIYPPFQLSSKNAVILNNESFVLQSGQRIYSTSTWDITQFNIQINFQLKSGSLNFDSSQADDNRKPLNPTLGFEQIIIGFFSSNNKPLYCIAVSASSFITDFYTTSFILPNISRTYTTNTSFPSDFSILLQSGSICYFTMNGFSMGYSPIDPSIHQENVKFGAIIEQKKGVSPSQVLVDRVEFL